jgi:nucleoside-diphosphate-sugar epimerase
LAGSDVVIHLAAIAHQHAAKPSDYETVNRDLPLALAKHAAEQDVRRFVFVSSVKAESPTTPYGRTKLEAEAILSKLSGIEVVSIRPALVYGWDAGGNIRSLLKLAALPVPLPFGASDNRRSLIAVENLCDALCYAATADIPSGVYTATDGEDITVRDIITGFRSGMGKKAGLFNARALPALLSMLGRKSLVEKLFGEERYESTLPGWCAPIASDEALVRTGREFRIRSVPPAQGLSSAS